VTTAETHLAKKRDRALVNSALATLVARGISAIATVSILAIAAHALTKSQLGVVAVLTLLSAFLAFGDFGLGTLLMTRLPEAHAKDDAEAKRLVVGVTLNTLFLTGGSIVALGVLATFLLPWQTLLGAHSLPDGEVRAAVLVFFIFGGVGIPATVGSRILASMLRSATAQIWLIAASMLSLGMTITCAELKLPIWAYVFAIAGGPTLVSIVQTIWVFTKVFPELRPSGFGVRPNVAWTFLRASSYFAIMSLSAVISYSIDSLVVSAVLGASVAAVFALAARMFTLVGVTIGLAGQQMWSALADAITRGDYAWARSRFWHTILISSGLTSFACALLVVFGRELSRLWVGSHLVPPLSLLVVLAIYTVYSTTALQASYLLAAVGRVKTFALIGVGAAVVNLVASIVLTHIYGLTGPILGSIVALVGVITIPMFVLLRRELKALD
jgi:O-antigen/teichoic acid export membrane protein